MSDKLKHKLIPIVTPSNSHLFVSEKLMARTKVPMTAFFKDKGDQKTLVDAFTFDTAAIAFNTQVNYFEACAAPSASSQHELSKEDLSIDAIYLAVKHPATNKKTIVKLASKGNKIFKGFAMLNPSIPNWYRFMTNLFVGRIQMENQGRLGDFTVALQLDIWVNVNMDTSDILLYNGRPPLLINVNPISNDQLHISEDMKTLSCIFADAEYVGYDFNAFSTLKETT